MVDDPGAGEDEELPSTPRPPWRERAEAFVRSRVGLPLVVLLAVLAVLVVRAVRHDRPAGAPAARSTPPAVAPEPTTVLLDPTTGQIVAAVPTRTGSEPARCPGLRCYTTASVPPAVTAAVRAALPGAQVTAAQTVRLVDPIHGNPLWYRAVTARAGSLTLALVVQAHSAGDAPDGGAKDDGATSQTYVDAPLQQWFVRERTSDRSGTGDRVAALTTLAHDPRILVVS